MQTVNRLDVLRSALAPLRARGRVALVPTMGALHEGHLALVAAARELAESVVVSIFVNPRQFGPREDLAAYPRSLESDSALLAQAGAAILWAPSAQEMYPVRYATTVSVAGPSEGLCGDARPGHFDGVATVVLKLFNQVRPDVAVFGEKDWQQLAVVRQMARDLDLEYPRADAIHAVPTVREPDGLARSSRNAYLDTAGRAAAGALPAAMRDAAARIGEGADIGAALQALRERLLAAGFTSVDYAELRDGETMQPLDRVTGPARLFVAARLGGTRLIDNLAVTRAT